MILLKKKDRFFEYANISFDYYENKIQIILNKKKTSTSFKKKFHFDHWILENTNTNNDWKFNHY